MCALPHEKAYFRVVVASPEMLPYARFTTKRRENGEVFDEFPSEARAAGPGCESLSGGQSHPEARHPRRIRRRNWLRPQVCYAAPDPPARATGCQDPAPTRAAVRA